MIAMLSACADGTRTPDSCDYKELVSVPTETIKMYKIIIHKDVPSNRVGLILDAAYEWVVATSGAVTFETTYSNFDISATPLDGEILVYEGPQTDGSSIGLDWSWKGQDNGHPTKSRIWILKDLEPRLYYLTAMHEFGHAIGLPHVDNSKGPAIMIPTCTDVGDHPTCVDRNNACALWGCDPGC